jgi:hypothetical protein
MFREERHLPFQPVGPHQIVIVHAEYPLIPGDFDAAIQGRSKPRVWLGEHPDPLIPGGILVQDIQGIVG